MNKATAWLIILGVSLTLLAAALWAVAQAMIYLNTIYADFFKGCGAGLIHLGVVVTALQLALYIRRLWIRSRNN